ncbi:MAG: hypothetical protein QMD71_06475 [bacterium]|nr:hypothetical protein [bacterium]
MKSLKTGGLQELGFFKNRVGRAYGRGEIDRSTFERLSAKVEDLLQELEALPKPDFEEDDEDE